MADITKLGKYLIRRELGKGAMGIVYEGFDPSIERTVAIKTLHAQQLGKAEAANVLARFKREAQAAGRLNHPGIVAIYDYGEVFPEDDHTLLVRPDSPEQQPQRVAFIAMEYVKGRELRDYFEANERFSIPDVARIMGEILSALSHAHGHGVVHRDLKPSNLIVLPDGRIKIADFGIARVEKSELTQEGTVMGTPSYMSPEQFMGHAVDRRSDLFSCGVILYQFLTGEKPFTGSTTTIMYKVLREDPIEPSTLNMAVPKAFDAVMKKAVAKNPDERYQTADEFSRAIQAAANLRTEPVPAFADDTLVTAPPGSVNSAPNGGAARSTKRLTLLLAALALMVAGGAALWRMSGPDLPMPPVASVPAGSQTEAPLPVAVAPVLPPVPVASATPALVKPLAPVAPVAPPPARKARALPPEGRVAAEHVVPTPTTTASVPGRPLAASPEQATVAPPQSDPKKTCADRILLGHLVCMSIECDKPAIRNHPSCIEWHAMEKSKQ
jgi:serine/threonine-protein kinase